MQSQQPILLERYYEIRSDIRQRLREICTHLPDGACERLIRNLALSQLRFSATEAGFAELQSYLAQELHETLGQPAMAGTASRASSAHTRPYADRPAPLIAPAQEASTGF
jgi:hypothetical protein